MPLFGRYCNSKARLVGKTVIITGANSGIGKETARDLYRRGARVILACRDMARANAAVEDIKKIQPSKPGREKFVGGPGDLVVYKLDLNSLASIRECAKQIWRTESAVHILINNAAVMMVPKGVTEDGFEIQFGINHLGHFLFTLLLLPKIIQSQRRGETCCRIINVSSSAHNLVKINVEDLMSDKTYNPFMVYCRSKIANILFTRELTRRLKGCCISEANIAGVNTYTLHPGIFKSNLSRHFDEVLFRGVKFFIRIGEFFVKNAKEAAQTTIHCAVDEGAAKETGLYYSQCAVAQPSNAAQDDLTAVKLWDASIELVGLPTNDLKDLVQKISREYATVCHQVPVKDYSYYISINLDKNCIVGPKVMPIYDYVNISEKCAVLAKNFIFSAHRFEFCCVCSSRINNCRKNPPSTRRCMISDLKPHVCLNVEIITAQAQAKIIDSVVFHKNSLIIHHWKSTMTIISPKLLLMGRKLSVVPFDLLPHCGTFNTPTASHIHDKQQYVRSKVSYDGFACNWRLPLTPSGDWLSRWLVNNVQVQHSLSPSVSWIEQHQPRVILVLCQSTPSINSVTGNCSCGEGFLSEMWPFSRSCQSTARLVGRTVVITGANTGIGKETARDLYRRGARVVLACRDLNKANAAIEEVKSVPPSNPTREQFVGDPGEVVAYKLDLNSLASVRECAKHISTTESAVHILINNAGVMMCPKGLTEDGFETQLGTNHLGHFLFTLLLLPKIIQSRKDSEPCSRIINVSSMAHERGDINFNDLMSEKSYSPMQAYNQSKVANVLFTRELARRLKEANITGINVYTLHPGVIKSELGRHLGAGSRFLLGIFRPFLKNVEQGAQTTIHCAVDEEAAKETGLYYKECAPTSPSSVALDDAKAARLWDTSIKLVGLPTHNLPELIEQVSKDYIK
ncbi:uncharacterized protein LOC124416289 [Diprion similis]|uniref:uncharacterized protein LOC124416289 n=1 Tax=Diprion similis TaxID=362088 RepID=UPI001EF78702|nr:uncharacterized protein LOC124416289 [Diprion similis]